MTGVDFVLIHLDGTKIRVKNEPGEVIKPDDLKTIPEKGLPFYKQPYKFGNLFVKFTVEFPDSIPVPKIAGLKASLPAPQQTPDADMEAETVMLTAFTESQRNTKAAGGQTANDSDDDEEEQRGPGGGQRVQCA